MGRSTAAAARAGPSQSQRPVATQGRGTNGKGKRAAPAPTQEDEEEDEEEMDVDENDGEGVNGGMDMDVDEVDENSELARKANAVIRLALFTEQKRTYLRREDITKKALGTSSRSFNAVMDLVQKKLRDTFGMELYLLPSRAGLEKDGGNQKEGGSTNQMATGLKKKAAATTSKNYILRSILDPVLIDRAAQTDETILEEEAGDQATLFPAYYDIDLDNPNGRANERANGRRRGGGGGSDEDDDDDDDDDIRQEAERAPKYYGSIISWSKCDQLGSLGILYVILALVLVHGRVIPDGKLRQYLKALRLPSTPGIKPIQYKSTSTTRETNLDDYLSVLLKQGYLHRQLVGEDVSKKGKGKGGAGAGAGVKRVRTQAEDMQAGQMYEWKWGVRAFAEVGEELVAKFVAEFMVSDYNVESVEDDDDEEEEEEEEEAPTRRGKRAADKGKAKAKAKAASATTAREKKKEVLKMMMSGVEKAAGGNLVDLN